MWYWREYIECLTSLGSDGGVGAAGHVEIKREVVSQHLLLKDVVEQAAIAPAQQDIMVRQACVRIAPPCAEIEHKERHAILHSLESTVRVPPSELLRNEVAIGKRHIRVRDYTIRGNDISVCQTQSCDSAFFCQNLNHGAAEMDRAAQFAQESTHTLHNRPGSSQRIVDTPLALQVVNHRVDRR